MKDMSAPRRGDFAGDIVVDPRDEVASEDAGVRQGDEVADGLAMLRRARAAARHAITALAFLLVLLVLVVPNGAAHQPAELARIPVEGVLGVALLLALPARATRSVATLMGVALGLLAIMKIVDVGFVAVLDRPFDPVLDWAFLESGVVFLSHSIGRFGTVAVVAGAALLAVAVLILVTLSLLRLSRVVVAHRGGAIRTVTVLGLAWVVSAVLGVQIVPGVPVAAHAYYDRLIQVDLSLKDREVFAAEASVDAFRDTPVESLLTTLRGKDVVVAFVESYGRVALEHPDLAPRISAVLDSGNRRLHAAGFTSRSAFLTSPTAGGGSWLAHATLLSGLWVSNQQRYHDLVLTDRLTLNGAFRRAGWRTVGVMPGITQGWPEGAFFGYDRIYAAGDLGYRGPQYSFATMPDQYTLAAFERLERTRRERGPLMAEIPLVSSHAPWAPIPQLIGWDDVGDGSDFEAASGAGDPAEIVWQRDPTRVRTDYGKSVEYSLNTLISYVETFGDDNLVLVFLGDHQPAPVVTGGGASRDVPITIVARDQVVLDQISGWGWQDGLRPGPQAPVWRMDTFRDRFLEAFGR